MKQFFKHIWVYLRPFCKWQFLVSYFIPFMLVNGWAWLGTFLLPFIGPNWFSAAAATWLAILWMPWTPEKLITIPMALWIHTRLFKNDKKTHDQLEAMYQQAKDDWARVKSKFKRRKK